MEWREPVERNGVEREREIHDLGWDGVDIHFLSQKKLRMKWVRVGRTFSFWKKAAAPLMQLMMM